MGLSFFDLSHEVKTSMDMGVLVPIYWRDVIPGDKIKVNTRFLVRTMPFISPVMDRIDAFTRFYYVPYRLLCKDFVDIIKLKDNDPRTMPCFSRKPRDLGKGSLLDYFGIHSSTDRISEYTMEKVSRMPFLAYYLIYNYYYRDPLLDEEYSDDISVDDLVRLSDEDILYPRRVNWSPDYFTSARPTTQYGSEVDLDMDGNGTIKVNEMRFAEALQRFKEKMLSSATYIDVIRKFFPAYPSDYAVQRPKLLSSNVQTLSITDVDQTAPSATDPLGTIAGKSVTVSVNAGYKSDFDEHGIVLGLMFVKPRQTYIAGIPRMFKKEDGFDLCFPHFANLGMQDIKSTELNAGADSDSSWGYQERYADYKYPINVVAGEFSNLRFWHFSRDIREEKLGNRFLTCIPSDEPFAIKRAVFDIENYSFLISTDKKTLVLAHKNSNKYQAYKARNWDETPLSSFETGQSLYYEDNPQQSEQGTFEIYDHTDQSVTEMRPREIYNGNKKGFIVDAYSFYFVYTAKEGLFLELTGRDMEHIDSNEFQRLPFVDIARFIDKVPDPIMVALYHDEKALRPLPKIYNPSL